MVVLVENCYPSQMMHATRCICQPAGIHCAQPRHALRILLFFARSHRCARYCANFRRPSSRIFPSAKRRADERPFCRIERDCETFATHIYMRRAIRVGVGGDDLAIVLEGSNSAFKRGSRSELEATGTRMKIEKGTATSSDRWLKHDARIPTCIASPFWTVL